MDSIVIQSTALALFTFCIYLFHSGREKICVFVLVGSAWLTIALTGLFQNEYDIHSFPLYLLSIAVAGFLLGKRAVLLLCSATAVVEICFFGLKGTWAIASERLPYTPSIQLEAHLLYIILGGAVIYQLAHSAEDGYSALIKSKQKLSAILNSIDSAVIVTNNSGRIQYMNPIAESITEWPLSEARDGLLNEVFKIIDDDDGKSALKYDSLGAISKQIRTVNELTVSSVDSINLMSRGNVLCPIIVSVASIQENDTDSYGQILVFRDITKQREIDRIVAQSQKLGSLGLMAAGIAHDFNNILAGMVGNASVLVQRLEGPEREVAERIVRTGKEASKMTAQLLAYSSNQPNPTEKIELNYIINLVVDITQSSQPANVHLRLNLTDMPLPLLAAQGQMHQLVLNFIINAYEAMSPDGGILTIETKRAKLDVAELVSYLAKRIIKSGEYVVFSIHDTGVGMEPAIQGKIFDPFFTTKADGQGLGLATISGIVHKYGGGIHVESQLGQGTRFTVVFPANINEV